MFSSGRINEYSNPGATGAAELLIEGGFATKEDFEIPESTKCMVEIYEKITNFFKKK